MSTWRLKLASWAARNAYIHGEVTQLIDPRAPDSYLVPIDVREYDEWLAGLLKSDKWKQAPDSRDYQLSAENYPKWAKNPRV